MLQTIVLENLKLQAKNQTLRILSDATDIQLTRIFRIINGAPMKANELEQICSYLEFDLALLPKDCSNELKNVARNWHSISPTLQKKFTAFLVEFHQLSEFSYATNLS